MLPFTVRGDVALGYLREGMVDLLSTAMDGFGDLRTVDPRALLAAAHAQPDPTDDAAGFELAARFGATHLLQGGVVSAGGKLRITATIRDLAGGVLSRAEVEGEGEGDLFALVDKMVRRLLVRGGTAPAERLSRLAGLTTVPLPALRAWLEGEQEFRLGRYLPALEAYQRAAALDGTFALAHYRVAGAAAANAMIAPARGASAAAMRYHQRLSERDRLLVEAQHSWLHGRADDAERRYAAVVAAHPDDLDAWFGLGDLLLHSNPYRGRSSREARAPLERATALDPQHVSALVKLARLAALEERQADLEALVDRILSKGPDHDQALPMRALRAYLRDDPEEQAEIIVQLAGARALTLGITFSDVTVYSRNLAGAERLGRALAGVARSDELRALVHLILAHLAAADGRLKDAGLELDAAERLDPAWALEIRGLLAALPFLEWPESFIQESRTALERWNPESVAPNVSLPLAFHNGLHPHLRAYLLGMLAARMGDGSGAAEASELLAELAIVDESEGLVERLERSVDSAVHQLRGDTERALTDLSGTRNNVWFQLAVASPFYAGTFERWRRAELLQGLGRIEEAKGWFGSLAERSPWEVVFRAPAERRLALMER